MAISSSSPAAAADELRLLSLMLKRFAPAMTEHQARGIAARIDAVVCHLGGRAPCPRDATAHDASAFVESLEPVSFLPPTPPAPARDAGATRTLPSLPSAEARPDTKPDSRPDRSTTQSKPEPLKTEPLLSSLGAAALSDIATVEGTTRPSAPESPAHSVVTPRVVLSQSARRSLQRQSLRDSTIHSAAHSAAHSSISLPRQDTFVTEGPNSARAPRPPAGRGNANGIFGGATPAMTPTSPSVLKAPHPPLPQGSGVGVAAASVSVQSVLPRSAVPGTGAAQRALVSTQLPDARDVEAIVGAAAFEMLEATLLAIGATSGALYLKVQTELVSVATIVPGRTYPAPIVRFTAAGSLANSVLSTGLALSQHLPGADDANVRHKNMLLFPVVTRDQRRVAVIQAADKYSGAAPFTPVDESILVNAACLFAELFTRGGKLVSWTGPAFDPVALHKASPFQPPLHPPEAVRALPPDIRDFRTPTLVLRTADAAAAVQRNKGRDDAVALSPLAPVMAVDCYVANLQTCWHRAVQRNMQHETRDAQRAKDLRVLQEDLDDAKKHAGTLEERLRLEGLGASDYQREYAALRAELGAYLDRRKMYE